eukprot:CAMPEP_0198291046 /NCGR_PEP_ID=MMETSP1449-20131203/8703_1 /TAXON_ID=420275 /ORGANISM="Attheya septentrionalis, Strain CCMP2084" /LENGTH=1902 /DNA_ID=CAMNT_0043989637 /DNA_START=351 /DNA_END=6059 /DNA_ORIENTATION=+
MAALAEAKARGLPEGWSVKFDSRRRRKWISPIGRVFDSLPKALAGATKLTETPYPCTKVAVGKKRPAPRASGTSSKRPHSSSSSKGARSSSNNGSPTSGSTKKSTAKILVAGHAEDDELVPPESDSDPETSLDGVLEHRPSTVHWDPNSVEGRKVGYRIRILDNDDPGDPWKRARLIRYDPYTNKYKIQFDDNEEVRKCDFVDKENCCWLLLKDEVVQTGSRFVWAVVKGFAWWPAQVLICEPSTPANKKEGYVYVEFLLTQEVALVKDTLDFVRPFNDGQVDDAMRKNKRKRNPEAVVMAREEEAATMAARTKAIHFYAEKAFALVNKKGSDYLARDISFFRSDVNYPYGENVKGRAQQYSTATKKWLVVYEPSMKTKTILYEPSWVNLLTKGIDCKRLDKAKHIEITEQDLIPFIFGTTEDDQGELDNTSCCKGCTQKITNHDILECRSCRGVYHPGCLDPPMTSKMADKAMDAWVCSKCIRCKGCNKLDIGFGCKPFPLPSTLYLAPGEQLELCSMCTPMYEADKFCASCGHIWDDVRYNKAQRAIKWLSKSKHKTKKKGKSAQGKNKKSPKNEKNTGGVSITGDSAHDEMSISTNASLDASRFYPDSNVWGFNEGSMLMCDGCSLWVHAACGSLTKEEYDETNAGVHPIYSTEFLCRVCCKRRCMSIIDFLQNHDAMMLFAMAVTEQMAPTYHDVIKNPMDLETMTRQAETGKYHNYAWLRDSFELMVLNALTFNRPNSKYWNEAKRYYKVCVENVFSKIGKGAPPGKYTDEVQAAFAKAVRELELEKERVQQDDTVEKKDLVAGSLIKAVELAPLCTPVDPPSCVPFAEVQIKHDDAFYCAWMECCFTCGSSGATDTMLFCVDCGEAYHSFCANVPIHSMDTAAVSRWRCANCKVCEISGDVPDDETKMLYCEMCDRAFTRDLLDPPLKFVPSGLWICGSCVDCKTCNNECDNGKISLKYWSRDPHMCFACGGCKGLVGRYTSGRKCGVCSKNLRSDESNVVECRTCEKAIHARCDPLARLELKDQTPGNEDMQNKRKHNNPGDNKYECPHCRRKQDTRELSKNVQQHLHSQAWNFVSSGIRPPRDMSKHEFFEVFCDEIEWRMKSMWRDEYRSLLRDGLRVLVLLDEKLDTKSYQTILSSEEHNKDFSWMRARASRFIRMAKRHKWTAENVGKPNIRSLVVLAKLASSFLHIALPYLKKKSVRYSERLSRLLVVPHTGTGVTEMPDDIIKTSGYRHIISEGDWKSKIWDDAAHERFMKFSLERGWTDCARKAEPTCNKKDNNTDANGNDLSTIDGRGPRNQVKPPKALSGWRKEVFSTKWKDPRTCCLCHACGDDDAGNDVNNIGNQNATGVSPATSPEVRIQNTGRLIPFEDGLWVHSNCALWSSEVWESPNDGLIHEFDKARNRGGKLKCFGCGRPGATLGCNKQNCAYNYHFACSTAAGAVLTSSQQMFCQKHKSFASDNTDVTCYEPMKIMTFAGDRETSDRDMVNFCYRVGSLIVHSLGEIEQDHDAFHSRHYITPPGYMATRVFWSSQTAQQRTLYALKIDRSKSGTPLFSITPTDDPGGEISCRTAVEAYNTLMKRVLKTNHKFFSQPDDMFSFLPMVRAPGQKAFGLNAAQFFGFGLNHVRKALERLPGAAAVAVPLTTSSPTYNFCFLHPQKSAITELQRNRAAAVAEKALENSSGCARTEGTKAVHKSGGSGRITRALVKRADDDAPTNASGLKTRGLNDDVKVELESNQAKYREMKSVPIDERLAARRSHIHGWGLFTKVDIPKHGMIIEYMGETVRQCIADKRERAYELAGVGSCYMFRLDLQRIVDATKIGCMARFMNHCCRPNAYAKVITADTEEGMDKKIVVFALRSISAGAEITYDYKFPVEDGSLRCTCGAPNCIGRLN